MLILLLFLRINSEIHKKKLLIKVYECSISIYGFLFLIFKVFKHICILIGYLI